MKEYIFLLALLPVAFAWAPACNLQEEQILYPNYDDASTYYSCATECVPTLQNCASGTVFVYVYQECVAPADALPNPQPQDLYTAPSTCDGTSALPPVTTTPKTTTPKPGKVTTTTIPTPPTPATIPTPEVIPGPSTPTGATPDVQPPGPLPTGIPTPIGPSPTPPNVKPPYATSPGGIQPGTTVPQPPGPPGS